MTHQNDRKTFLFLLVGVMAGAKRVIFEKISHFCFLKQLAEILLDLRSAKLGINLVVQNDKGIILLLKILH